ncbi:hypothetical protein BDP27DRAFT_1455173 [Rhodocollybia butyracea]|uniref:UDP-Glycosyltransferase/glycogen phosphorylase n=1 Tax=Rhodocollybia butyracea TaxID=206335 RepID=A0A9P5P7V7_9AGAR|nr:hypothetical protein BDP27DRAFT_1455173 [Rhodocollybia butyracea]
MPPTHILFHALPAWGHTKPMACFAVFLCRARPDIVITIVVAKNVYSKLVHELKSKLSPNEYHALASRINIIDICGMDVMPLMNLEEFSGFYTDLCNNKPIQCKSSGKIFSGLSFPVIAIIDPLCPYAFEIIRNETPTKVTIISWMSIACGPLLEMFGPAELGGRTDPVMEIEAERKQARASIFNAQGDYSSERKKPSTAPPTHGYRKAVVPGLPPMYMHELFPQIDVLLGANSGLLAERAATFGQIYLREGDGLIVVSNSVYEQETLIATKTWFNSIGVPTYAFAPLSLPQPQLHQVSSDEEVSRFLDAMKERFGPRSLLYISFGTLFFPHQQEKLVALIEVLIKNQVPFLFAHASPLFEPSDQFSTLIKDSGIGMAMSWSPQESVLQNEVTGWFVTHGGWNSIQESFQYKVPLILWPMSGDQPVNAATLTCTHKAAFELIEVRSGEDGTKPLLRFENIDYKPTFTVDAVRVEVEELLVKIRGEEGRMVRSNFEDLSDNMLRSWEWGECNYSLHELLKLLPI